MCNPGTSQGSPKSFQEFDKVKTVLLIIVRHELSSSLQLSHEHTIEFSKSYRHFMISPLWWLMECVFVYSCILQISQFQFLMLQIDRYHPHTQKLSEVFNNTEESKWVLKPKRLRSPALTSLLQRKLAPSSLIMESCKANVSSPNRHQSLFFPSQMSGEAPSLAISGAFESKPQQDKMPPAFPAREQPQPEHTWWPHYTEQSPSTGGELWNRQLSQLTLLL